MGDDGPLCSALSRLSIGPLLPAAPSCAACLNAQNHTFQLQHELIECSGRTETFPEIGVVSSHVIKVDGVAHEAGECGCGGEDSDLGGVAGTHVVRGEEASERVRGRRGRDDVRLVWVCDDLLVMRGRNEKTKIPNAAIVSDPPTLPFTEASKNKQELRLSL